MMPSSRIRSPARYATPKNTRQQRDRGAEVRLLGDEQQRKGREDAADDEIARVARAPAVLAEVHREDQRDAEAAEFGRLEVERTDRNPALAGLHRPLKSTNTSRTTSAP